MNLEVGLISIKQLQKWVLLGTQFDFFYAMLTVRLSKFKQAKLNSVQIDGVWLDDNDGIFWLLTRLI